MAEKPGTIEDFAKCVISTDREGTFRVHEDVLEELENIKSHAFVVAITGDLRTGKSYLMNRIAGGRDMGFKTGSQSQAVTEGLWIWVRDHPKRHGMKVLLVDTEGLGDASKEGVDHDNKIFILATLLSSILIYNTTGVVKQGFLSYLSCVTELAKKVKDDSTAIAAPTLIVALRDFTLDLGEQTPDDYLKGLLQGEEGSHSELAATSRVITSFFTKRKCFIFDSPAHGRGRLSKLDELPEEELSEDFRQDFEKLTDYLFTEEKDSTIRGISLNCRIVADLLRQYVSSMNEGKIPHQEADVLDLVSRENEKIVKELLTQFSADLEEGLVLPLEKTLEVRHKYDGLLLTYEKKFAHSAYGDSSMMEKQLLKLKEQAAQLLDQFLEKDAKRSKELSNKWLLEHIVSFRAKIKKAEYVKKGHSDKLDHELNELKSSFVKAPGLGRKKDQVWNAFKCECHLLNAAILESICRTSFKEWKDVREETISLFEKVIKEITEAERKHSQYQIGYSTAGLLSGGLFVTGVVLSPFTFGLSLAVGATGVAGGVASAGASFAHSIKKNRMLVEKEQELRHQHKEDCKAHKKLVEYKDEFKHSIIKTQDFNDRKQKSGILQGMKSLGYLLSVVDVADDVFDLTNMFVKASIPMVFVSSLVDAVQIIYNINYLKKEKITPRVKHLTVLLNQIKQSFEEAQSKFLSIFHTF